MLGISNMISTIRAEAKNASAWTGCAEISARVLDAMAAVPRHEFVSANLQYSAYDNSPLPIGYGQTISQPYIVALMTDLLNLGENDKVLEVGTGSGYQAAVLARMVRQVYSMEIISALAMSARRRVRDLGYSNLEVVWGNGFHGLPQYAPFDAILVAAAPTQVPDALLEQLKPGGRLVIPVGNRGFGQDLKLLQKDGRGAISEKTVLPVSFVPLLDQKLTEQVSPR